MIERREHTRFKAERGTFALLRSTSIELSKIRDMGMGEIAFAVIKSKPVKMGQIVNISMDGLAFDYIEHRNEAVEVSKLDILFAADAFYLDKLLFQTIFDFEIVPKLPLNTFVIRRCGIQFGELDCFQKSRLEYFLNKHAAEEEIISPDLKKWSHTWIATAAGVNPENCPA
jgi:hypothetical protein